MTTIIGYYNEKQVLFCSDRQRSRLNSNGEFQGVIDNSRKKIYPIGDQVAIAAGGIIEPIETAIENINSVAELETYDLSSLIELCKTEFSIAYIDFLASRGEINYSTLYFLLGGICPQSKRTFLYSFRSDDNFSPTRYEPFNIITMGNGVENNPDLVHKLNNIPSPFLLEQKYFLYHFFTNAIREYSSRYDSTGAETYSYLIEKHSSEERIMDGDGKVLRE